MTQKTVILISKDPSFFEKEETWFNRRGVDVFCATSLQELVAIAGIRPPDLVISAGPPDGTREHMYRERIQESVPLVVLHRGSEDEKIVTEYTAGFRSTVIHRPYGNRILRATEAALASSSRHYLRVLVQFSLDSATRSGAFGFSQNLSPTGMLIETKRELQIRDRMAMSFMLPGKRDMTQVNVEVVRRAPSLKADSCCYGVQFLDLPAEDRAFIDSLNQASEHQQAHEQGKRSNTVAYCS